MATLTQAGFGPEPRSARAPRAWPVYPSDIAVVLAAIGLLVFGMWVVHGGLDGLGTPAGLLSGLGQVAALIGTYLALVQIVLMARVPWIDHVVGSDKLMAWHRWLGFGTVSLILAHVAFTTAGWAMTSGAGVLDEFLALNAMWDILIATVATALLLIVAITSIRAVRRRLSYEAWFGLHLYAYLGIALAFLHQVTIGADFIGDRLAVAFWVALYIVTFGLLVWYRVITPIRVSARHRLRVAAVVPEARGVVSIYLTGNALDELPVVAGQFFHVRFLRRGGWWRPHPFSISAAPDGRCLRMTVKDLGDDTHRMMTMPVGTPVFIEGPYGAFTPKVVTRDHVVMLGGGVGVTPLRAIFEALPPGRCHITFLYREGDSADTIFREELLALASRHGATLRFLEGHRGSAQMPIDPLTPEWLYRHAPHITAADVLVCGSRSFTERVLASLRTLRVPDDHIHAERFGY